MVCKKCGCPLDEGVRFCTQCGAKVEADEPVAAAEETPVTTEAPVKAPEPAAAAEQPAEAAQAPEVEAAAPEAPALEAPVEEAPEVEPVVEAAEIAEAFVAEDTDVTEAEATEPVADAVEIAEAVAAGATEPGTPVPPTNCAVCGAELTAGVQFCPSCGTPVPQPAPKKRKIWPWLVGAAALVALCVVLVVCLLLPKKGPFDELSEAFVNTAKADNFGGTATITSGPFNQVNFSYQFTKNNGEPALVLDDGAGSTIVFYKGYQLYHVAGYGSFKEEMTEQIAQAFDSENMGKIEVEIADWEDLDIRALLEKADPSGDVLASLNEGMDIDVLNECLRKLPEKFQDEEWLKEHLSFDIAENGNVKTYSLTIDMRLFVGMVEQLKPAFRDPADYETILDELNDMDASEFSINLSATTEGKYLTGMSMNLIVNDMPIGIDMTFSEIGTTAVDIEQLDAWLAEAEE